MHSIDTEQFLRLNGVEQTQEELGLESSNNTTGSEKPAGLCRDQSCCSERANDDLAKRRKPSEAQMTAKTLSRFFESSLDQIEQDRWTEGLRVPLLMQPPLRYRRLDHTEANLTSYQGIHGPTEGVAKKWRWRTSC